LIGGAEFIYTNYTGAFPGTVVSDARAAHPVTDVVTKPDCFSRVTAQALADAIRAQRQVDKVTLEYSTDTPGLVVGAKQSVQLSARGLPVATDFLITEIARRHLGGTMWRYDVTAQKGGTVYLGSWRDDWAQLSSGSGGTVISGGGGGGMGTARVPYFLGGSAFEGVSSPTPTWVSPSSGAMQVAIDSTARGTTAGVVTVRMKARTGGVTVQARFQNLSDGSTVGTGTVVTSTSWVTDTFNVVLAAGMKTYELQVLPGTANEDVWCAGRID
jgi:hypothetical protein